MAFKLFSNARDVTKLASGLRSFHNVFTTAQLCEAGELLFLLILLSYAKFFRGICLHRVDFAGGGKLGHQEKTLWFVGLSSAEMKSTNVLIGEGTIIDLNPRAFPC